MTKNSIKAAAFLCLTVLLLSAPFGAGAEVARPVFGSERELLLETLFEGSIADVREAVLSGDVSCTEVTAYYLRRIEQYNKEYNCFITLCGNCMELAAQRDAQRAAGETDGLLFGVPVVIKDNMDYAGFLTTNGEQQKYPRTAFSNAAAVDALLREGAVILGKTNMSTAAQHAVDCVSEVAGQTLNAYDPSLSAGGSSGGTAAAVSLNFAVAGLGTDTNSSLRIPATLNGCVALRSTFGLVDRGGIVTLDPDRDVAGAITRTVEDTAVMMDVLTGGAYGFADSLDADALEGKRLGLVREMLISDEAETEALKRFGSALEILSSAGAEVVLVSFPYEEDKNFTTRTREEAASALEKLMREKELDALVYPNLASAPPASYPASRENAFANNSWVFVPVLGLPEVVVPMGRHSNGGGLSLAFSSLKGNDALLLDLAYSFECLTGSREAPAQTATAYEQQGYTLEEAEQFVKERQAARRGRAAVTPC